MPELRTQGRSIDLSSQTFGLVRPSPFVGFERYSMEGVMANYVTSSNRQANDCVDFFMFPREWRIVILLLKLGYHSEAQFL